MHLCLFQEENWHMEPYHTFDDHCIAFEDGVFDGEDYNAESLGLVTIHIDICVIAHSRC